MVHQALSSLFFRNEREDVKYELVDQALSASFFRNDDTIERDVKYELVDQILSASDYYETLEIADDASFEEIRKAYIKKSRACHPDKFVPPYPEATRSFQILSEAYKTLSEPELRAFYDQGLLNQYLPRISEDNAVDIFQDVIKQLCIEIMEGEFQTLRTVIQVINNTNDIIHINEEVQTMTETGFLKIREIILSSQKCYHIVQNELLRLYDLQDEMNQLPYFDIWRRLTLSMDIARIIIQIPLLVNRAVNQVNCAEQEGGLLGLQIEYCLEKAIDLY